VIARGTIDDTKKVREYYGPTILSPERLARLLDLKRCVVKLAAIDTKTKKPRTIALSESDHLQLTVRTDPISKEIKSQGTAP